MLYYVSIENCLWCCRAPQADKTAAFTSGSHAVCLLISIAAYNFISRVQKALNYLYNNQPFKRGAVSINLNTHTA